MKAPKPFRLKRAKWGRGLPSKPTPVLTKTEQKYRKFVMAPRIYGLQINPTNLDFSQMLAMLFLVPIVAINDLGRSQEITLMASSPNILVLCIEVWYMLLDII